MTYEKTAIKCAETIRDVTCPTSMLGMYKQLENYLQEVDLKSANSIRNVANENPHISKGIIGEALEYIIQNR